MKKDERLLNCVKENPVWAAVPNTLDCALTELKLKPMRDAYKTR